MSVISISEINAYLKCIIAYNRKLQSSENKAQGCQKRFRLYHKSSTKCYLHGRITKISTK